LPAADDVLKAIDSSLDHDKAEDVVVMPLAGKSTIADYMVVASGTSKRHIGSMAEHVVERIKALGGAVISVEGAAQGDWVLIDAGDVVVHLFRPEIREFYSLERLWGAPSLIATRAAAAKRGIGLTA
jgi:ribosome-associated protein